VVGHEDVEVDGGEPDIEAQVLRLSALYAVLDCAEAIRPPHLRAALAL
jgi:hypothetical protein